MDRSVDILPSNIRRSGGISIERQGTIVRLVERRKLSLRVGLFSSSQNLDTRLRNPENEH